MSVDNPKTLPSPESLLDLLGVDESILPLESEVDDTSWSTSSIQLDIKNGVNKLDYLIEIDRKNSCLTLTSRTGDIIGKIGKATFKKGSFETNNHLYKKIEKKYRGKGYGTIIMQEYINAGFPLPDFEYTTDYSVVKLLQKFGYTFFSLINKNGEENPYIKISSENQLKKYLERGYIISLIKSD